MKADATKRFTNRVDNYVKYRPSYPADVIDCLVNETAIPADGFVADIGSGTGIFTNLLLKSNFKVFAVEPNKAMRVSAEAAFFNNPNFISVNGTAENTRLSNNSCDLIVCAQTFHWFDAIQCQTEFKRILKHGDGFVALIWNNRQADADAFAVAYEDLLQQNTADYKESNHQNLNDVNFAAFFKDGQYTLHKFANMQSFDAEGLAGRAFSSSYVPAPETAEGVEFALLLKGVFDNHQVDGRVNFTYQTQVYLGQL